MIKKATIFLVLFLMAVSTPAIETPVEAKASETFTDLSGVSWAEKAIYFLNKREIINGYGNGKFGPTDEITREQAALMLVRELYPNHDEIPYDTPTFTDVKPDNSDSYRAIAIAVENGLFEGFPDGSFRPKDPITRAATAKIFSIAYDLKGTDADFSDLYQAPWAVKYIKGLSSHDIINGYPDHTFRPNQTISRAEFSISLARILDDTFKPEKVSELYLRVVDYYNQSYSLKDSVVDIYNENGEFIQSIAILPGEEHTKVELPEGKYKLRAKAPGFDFYSYGDLELVRGGGVDFVMRGETKIQGKVHHQGSPVANAVVKVFDRTWNEVWETTTDENGHYTFNLNDGIYSLKVQAPNYEESTKEYINIYKTAEVVNFPIDPIEEDKVATFADPNLEYAIRVKIGNENDEIYKSQLKEITDLNLDSKDISNLAGIEHLSKLKRLSLAYNQISDISPLQHLTKLVELDLSFNEISKIEALEGLTELYKIKADRNEITDITPVQNLPFLVEVDFDYNKIEDVSPLSQLEQLRTIYLKSNQISDISTLVTLPNLNQLYLDNNDLDSFDQQVLLEQLREKRVSISY